MKLLRTPTVQIVAAVGVMVGGAWLIAMWAVGVVLVVGGLLWALDAVLRDSGDRLEDMSAHEAVLEKYRRQP